MRYVERPCWKKNDPEGHDGVNEWVDEREVKKDANDVLPSESAANEIWSSEDDLGKEGKEDEGRAGCGPVGVAQVEEEECGVDVGDDVCRRENYIETNVRPNVFHFTHKCICEICMKCIWGAFE